MSQYEAYLAGYWTADGCTYAAAEYTHLYGNEHDVARVRKALGIVRPSFSPVFKKMKGLNCWVLYLGRWFAELLRTQGLDPRTRSTTKELPSDFINWSDLEKRAFLAGLFDEDGHVWQGIGKDGTSRARVGLTTKSPNLAEGVQQTLLGFNLNTMITISKARSAYDVLIRKSSYRRFGELVPLQEKKRLILQNVIGA